METFAKRADWFSVWRALDPLPWGGRLFVDRSPCSEPFLDPLHVGMPDHRPTVSGLCRPTLNSKLRVGNRRIYVARIGEKIDRATLEPYVSFGHATGNPKEKLYAVVADLEIVDTFPSHEKAEAAFPRLRQWVPKRDPTQYPPNLGPAEEHAVPSNWCVCYDANDHPYLPDPKTNTGSTVAWQSNLGEYQRRAARTGYAICRARFIDVKRPPVFTGRELIRWLPSANGNCVKDAYPAGNVAGRVVVEHPAFWREVRSRSSRKTTHWLYHPRSGG